MDNQRLVACGKDAKSHYKSQIDFFVAFYFSLFAARFHLVAKTDGVCVKERKTKKTINLCQNDHEKKNEASLAER